MAFFYPQQKDPKQPKPTKPKERGRLIVLSFLAALLCGGYLLQLMNIQIVRGEEFLSQVQTTTTSRFSVKAARGTISDVNGVALAENKVGYNIVFYYSFFPKSQRNEIIARLIALLEKNGESWSDLLPLTLEGEPAFLEGEESEITKLKELLEVNVYATAEDCIYNLRENYGIDEDCDDLLARKIAGVRYTMDRNAFSVNNNQYTFAADVSSDTVMEIKEMSYLLPGVDIVDEDIRVYPEGTAAPHLIGVVGKMYAEEYAETYKDLGYKMDSLVGKFGIEKALETTLHGVDGIKTVEQSSEGAILSEAVTTEPESGKNVVLTLDVDFQQKVQEILADHIEWLKGRPSDENGDNGNKVEGGSVVVLDAKTGGVLAAVTYPSYDLNAYFSDYQSLLQAEYSPLNNRAVNGLYRPGSTFKTAVAVGALEEAVITPSETVACHQVYTYYDIIPGNQFHPECLGYHGDIEVVRALTVSCNIFFYDVGRRLGIDKIVKYANLLGLGTDTGLEIPSAVGGITSPERSEALGTEWYQGNVCQASIGQMDTMVSPLQMALQAMTIANRGTRYKAHLVKEIRSYDNKEVVETVEPEVMASFEMDESTFQAVKAGMIGAATDIYRAPTYPREVALDESVLGYPVALKTGTPQVTATTFNSTAIAFAPADDADIAIGIVLEKGDQAKYLVRAILDAYYGKDSTPAGGGDSSSSSDIQE